MVLSLSERHNFSWTAACDILKMFYHIYKKDVLKISKYKLLKFFSSKRPLNVHIFCDNCLEYIGQKNNINNRRCSKCKAKVNNDSKSSFITFNMKNALGKLLQKKVVQNSIFSSNPQSDTVISDVYDGESYKSLNKDKYDITYSFNTDGVQSSKSGKQSIWPLYVCINEIPIKIRTRESILLGNDFC